MIPDKHKKRSFIKFDFTVESDLLEEDFSKITEEDWLTSYWGSVHCSVGMLLLRGGNSGTPEDFFCKEVSNQEVLEKLPYVKRLISEDGPLGAAKYAFIFKTAPNGVTLKHQDLMDVWKSMYRIHVPIYTNSGAYLISDGLSQHFQKGWMWSFNNHSDHGVVNGNQERVHLIFDVPYNKKLANAIERSDILEGENLPENVNRISQKTQSVDSYPGDIIIKHAIKTLKNRGVNDQQIASFFNSKKIPTKTYTQSGWEESSIQAIWNYLNN